ncbi:uncharacterized protein N7518_005854 [Penicillium psychrosexuale]|uniref:uncharacterized protein n=1 Tax=Penicillium psychrosexuale TaxID=1002107 RepID=UPI0025455419|nr:uncharacterized protein N7518_005854 [Penicillium psychrosexuale]KAJ5788843.1 hypothetical protein N7518_005854 [Penicillium psychrosexuale]
MARRWIWSFKLEHLPGDGHLPLRTNMLTIKDQGLASAGYQRCRVPGDWVESKPGVRIGDGKTKVRDKTKRSIMI